MTTAAAFLALVVGVNRTWPLIGWTTPNQHNADIVAFSEAVAEFRDEWKCDEYEEELIALLDLLKAGDESTETKRAIEKLRKKIDKLDCQRFDD